MEAIIQFIEGNYTWLIPSFFGFITLIVLFCKKGHLDANDVAKVVASQKVIATALTVLLEKEKKNEKIQSEKKLEEAQKN